MRILFMMTEPRVMKYYHEALRFMLADESLTVYPWR